ncbi:serine/threonine-protein kinase pakE isoform X3 [Octopus bimaculoides]|uniref:serine/threonine-protein kinase pakE isoform X3 n=1 Tax=Octopus bimaculoides TaxID=37653 RepID=UPI0022E29AC8|nr:serine/threonine-protein kinase pakE isoform X3 [Octopus bimaculoides]
MGLDFKEAFSSFLHQYFHANATFWNSVKICGNFKVAVDDYQEDYLFSEVITKSDCCCSNGLDKINTPIRGSGQAPIIIKEEPNEANRPSVLSGEVVTTSSTNLSTITNNSTTNTVIPNNASLSTSSSNGNNTNNIQTVADKTNNCGTTSSQSSHIETVLSPDTNYAVPPTRPSRWYISNCQPQTSDIDGRTILPSMPLLVTSTPAAPSSPNKITDMLQITSCEGEEEAAALQTFSSAQDPIPTEESVTLQGATSFATETQVAGQPPSLLSSYLQLTYTNAVDKNLAPMTPLPTCPHNSSSNDSIASNSDRPLAGFLSKDIADKYSMKELLPGSSIYIYDEQLHGVRKKAYDKKGKIDGRRMARQLMNIFFKRHELINCSISSSPAAGKTQLNPVLVNSIISYCQVNSTTLKSAIKDAMWSKITSANAKFAKKMKIQQIQQIQR